MEENDKVADGTIASEHAEHPSKGQQLFRDKCASCHAMDRIITGPPLRGVTARGPWAEDSSNFKKWLIDPAAFIPTTVYTIELRKLYPITMPGFRGQLSDADVAELFRYLKINSGMAGAQAVAMR